MRVISGSLRGLRLKSHSDYSIRPTTDRAKEGLFNVLNQNVLDSTFLDIFAGSGAIGIEACSRGAKRVVFVENTSQGIKLIKENTVKVENDISIINNNVITYLNTTTEKFDYIFMDPPYNIERTAVDEIVKVIKDNKLLSTNGELIIELNEKRQLEFDGFETFKFKKYGVSSFSFVKDNDE